MRAAAMVLLGLLFLSVMVVPAYPAAASPAFTVDSWTRDGQQPELASYRMTLSATPGGRCGATSTTACSYAVEARYADQFTDQRQAAVASGTLYVADEPIALTFAADDRTVAPVTQVVATLTPRDGSAPYEWVVPVADSFVYPAPAPSVRVVSFERGVGDETRASFALELDFEGMGSPGAPCWETNTYSNRCYYTVRLEHRSEAPAQVQYSYASYTHTTDSATGHSPVVVHGRSDWLLAPVTHAVVTMYGAYGSGPGSRDEPFEWVLPVIDPRLIWEAPERVDDALTVQLDSEVIGGGLALLVAADRIDDATLTLALNQAPCTRSAGSSLNDCALAFSSALASGATQAAALGYVIQVYGPAVVSTVTDWLTPTADPLAEPHPVPIYPVTPVEPSGKPVPPLYDPPDLGTVQHDDAVAYFVEFAEVVGYTHADVAGDLCSQVLRDGASYDRAVTTFCLDLRASVAVGTVTSLVDAARLAYRTISAEQGTTFLFNASAAQHRDELIARAAGSGGPYEPSTARGGICDDGDVPESLDHPLDLSTESLSPEAAADLIEYARLTNSWLAKYGPATVSSTAGALRSAASALARGARDAAEAMSVPIEPGLEFGHAPDSAISGTAEPPCGWLLMEASANQVAGSALGARVGTLVSHLTVDGIMP